MYTERRSSRDGQALIMVTIALVAMSGLIGMVLDFGWSYFIRKAEQAAADSAALAAVNAAQDAVTQGLTTYSSLGGNATPVLCSVGFSDNRQSACAYAQQNGFSASQVRVSADITSPHPTGVNTNYWVTVQISNTIPQLYSAILGNPYATVGAKATAAVVAAGANLSIVGLNRENDASPAWQNQPPAGTNPDFVAGTGSAVNINLGIALASTDGAAGYDQGQMPCSQDAGNPPTCVTYTSTQSRGGLQGNWNAGTSLQNQADGASFYDPYRGLGQPPLTQSALTQYKVPNGNLDAACGTGTCAPGVYYATDSNGNPTGAPLTTTGTLSFANGGSFGDYVFYGGLNISGSNTVTFGSGRYVMAGVLNSASDVLNIASTATAIGASGQVFILTNTNYPGLQQVASVPGLPALSFGQTDIEGRVALNGLSSATNLPTDANQQSSTLADFGNLLFWQDQRFTSVTYTGSGNIDISCGSLEQPCTNPAPPTNPQLAVGGGSLHMNGVVYQPRGAWLRVKPSAIIKGAIILISGALDIGANATINPDGPVRTQALKVHIVSLVE